MTDSDQHRHLGNLLKGTTLSVFNFGVGLALGFFLAPFVLETLGRRYYAINFLAGSLVGVFALINFGIDGAVSRYFTVAFAKGDKDECLKLGNTAFWLYTALGLVGFVGILLTALGVYFLYPDMEDRRLLFLVVSLNAVAFGLNYPLMALTGIVNGTLRYELTQTRALFFRVAGAVATFLILYFGRDVASPASLLIGMGLLNILLTFFNAAVMFRLVYLAFPEFRFRLALFRKDRLRRLFAYGFFTFLIFVANALQNQGSVFIVSAMIDMEAIALYSMIAVSLSGHFMNITELILGNWLVSWMTFLHASDDHTAAEKTLRLAYKLSIGIATFIAFGLIVWGPDFLARWGRGRTDDYMTAYPALVLLTLAVWCNQCQAPNTKYLFAVARHAIIGYASLIAAAAALALTAILIRLGYGVEGAALSVLIAAVVVRGITIPVYLCRLRHESPARYYGKITLYTALALAACALPLLISWQWLGPTFPRLFLVGGLSTVVYFPLYFFVALNREEKTKIHEIVFRKLLPKNS